MLVNWRNLPHSLGLGDEAGGQQSEEEYAGESIFLRRFRLKSAKVGGSLFLGLQHDGVHSDREDCEQAVFPQNCFRQPQEPRCLWRFHFIDGFILDGSVGFIRRFFKKRGIFIKTAI